MNRLPDRRQPRLPNITLSRAWLKWVSSALLVLGVVSATVLQRGVLRMETTSMEALSQAMKPSGGMMGWVTLTVVFALCSTLALPMYARLLVVGWERSGKLSRYALRLGVLAALCEPCYDFAATGRWFDPASQNPVWGLLLALAALEILKRYKTTGGLDVAIKTAVIAASVLWAMLFRVRWGPALILLCVLFSLLGENRPLMHLLSVIVTLFYFPAPLGLPPANWYDPDKPGRLPTPRWLFYGLYPTALLVCGAVTARIL